MNFGKLRQEVLTRDNNTCQICLKKFKDLDVHHIIPRRKQGLDSMNNLVSVCQKCHYLIELYYLDGKHLHKKPISVKEETYNELVGLVTRYKESMDDIVKKCIKAYKKENKK